MMALEEYELLCTANWTNLKKDSENCISRDCSCEIHLDS
jgi:hypothetical protein